MRNEQLDSIGLQHLMMPKKETAGKKHQPQSKFGEADDPLPHDLFEGQGEPRNSDYKGYLPIILMRKEKVQEMLEKINDDINRRQDRFRRRENNFRTEIDQMQEKLRIRIADDNLEKKDKWQ